MKTTIGWLKTHLETDASPEIAYATAAPMRLGMIYEWPPVVSATKTTAVSGALYPAAINAAIPTAA